MGQIEVFSPAKINLFLAVLGRMESGFHELSSLVAPLDFGDRLVVSSEAGRREVTLDCDDPSLPVDEGNLAHAAARAFLQRFGLERKVRVELTKRVPHGAGLGGGSSNAAATLEALARLEGYPVDDELEILAAGLGSDCPLFLRRRPLVMRGRGEALEELADAARSRLAGRRVLLFRPSVAIGTAWAYGRFARFPSPFAEAAWAEKRLAAWQAGDLALEQLLFNSFEAVVFPKFPAFSLMVESLRDLGCSTLMTGSGSCFFALCPSEEVESEAERQVRRNWGETCFARSAKLL